MSSPAIDIEKMSPEERLRLIEVLWESLRRRPETLPLTEAQRAGLGEEFLAAVDAAVASVLEYPEAYPVVHRGTRPPGGRAHSSRF